MRGFVPSLHGVRAPTVRHCNSTVSLPPDAFSRRAALAATRCDNGQLADKRDHQTPLDSTTLGSRRVGSENARTPVIKAIHPASPLNSEATVSRKVAARCIKF